MEEYGNTLFVDYATTTDPNNTDRRSAQLYWVVSTFGRGINNGEFTKSSDVYDGKYGVADIFIEERHVLDNGTYDVRSWTLTNSTDASKVATGEKSIQETFSMLREEDMVKEDDNLQK